MKALILAAGRGNRLSDKTNNTNKCMLEINGIPVLEYNIRRASEIDEINEIIIVVGYQKEDIMKYFSNYYDGRNIKYVYQWEQLGLVNAIEVAKEALSGEDFFLMLGDEVLVNSKHKEMINDFNAFGAFGLCGVVIRSYGDLEKISKTYTVLFSGNWKINRIIEKPKYQHNIFQGTGQCIFRNEILDYISETPINIRRGRQEKELPDLIQCTIDDGKEIRHFVVADDYANINDKNDLKEAEKLME